MELPHATGTSPIRVLIADSNEMERQLLAGALRRHSDFTISSCKFDFGAIENLLISSPADVTVLNVPHQENREGALGVVHRLSLSHPELSQVLLLESYDQELVIHAFRAGVKGLFSLSDDHPFRMLCKCIHRVHEGEIWANAEQIRFLLGTISQVPSLRTVNASGVRLLTPREEQVVALIADGFSNREVARELNLSENTIKKYVFRIFDKLGISSRVELVLYAMNHGTHREAELIAANA